MRRFFKPILLKEGGGIFAQLWHVGRVSHFALQPQESTPVAPSVIQVNRQRLLLRQGQVRARWLPLIFV